MGGAPSSRGCSACRAQKKGCDQGKPACSRCLRLGIECVGSGKKRYVFKISHIQATEPKSSDTSRETSAPLMPLRRSPSNDATLAASAIVSILQGPECRYDIRIYGLFWDSIPQRLAANQVLSAVVHAFSLMFPSATSGQCMPRDALVAYGKALKLLRGTLNDETKANDPNVLCAIHVNAISQSWLGKGDASYSPYRKMIRSRLPQMIRQRDKSPFEEDLLLKLCRQTILISMVDASIDLEPWLSVLLEYCTPIRPWISDDGVDLLKHSHLHRLARYPLFIRRPQDHLDEMSQIYEPLRRDRLIFQQRIRALKLLDDVEIARAAEMNVSLATLHAHYRLGYCITLTHAAYLISLLRPFKRWHSQKLASILRSDEIDVPELFLGLMHDMLSLRPIFTKGLPVGFVSVWAMTNDRKKEKELEELLLEFCDQITATGLKEGVMSIKSRLCEIEQEACSESDRRTNSPLSKYPLEIDADDIFATRKSKTADECFIL